MFWFAAALDKATCCLKLALDIFASYKNLASAEAIGNAASIVACTIAAPAILEPAKPRDAIAALAALIAPAAHTGVPFSNCAISSDIWPCTVDLAVTFTCAASARYCDIVPCSATALAAVFNSLATAATASTACPICNPCASASISSCAPTRPSAPAIVD